ncbi:ScbA/BarX family gamma-butyrolactone biosynthesis protein [Streptomyces thermovulgaris]|uniref:ScbA/BarX family gamma-butyrolactone biosynthesis protein n=1 Tax=Streptomyces thermovulgaris TaxID=1934 RepID=UPI001302E10C|nr:ScbA/BarX family gamma-butyrolactone biosynthesis protein [Streptomyces thermovulgaris]
MKTTVAHDMARATTSPRAVTQQLVHKADAAEALLTHWSRMASDSFRVAARWPVDHPFYTALSGAYEPLLVSETIRQLFPLLCHAAYEVPFGHHLVWERYDCTLDPEVLRPGPATPELRATCRDLVHRRGRVRAMTMHIELVRDDVVRARARSRFTIQALVVYDRLRGDRADTARAMAAAVPVPEPALPKTVGRDRAADVVLSPADRPGRWQLRVDTRHPKLFDHPVDHVPGMLLLEAAQQAARAVRRPARVLPVALETAFHRYVEFDRPCWIEAHPLETGTVRVVARQDGEDRFTADVRTRGAR